jgi:hypothetical protein
MKWQKERAVNDLSNERWPHDFELEITNTGDKPIYFVKMLLLTGVVGLEGVERAFSVSYGSIKLGPVDYQARPEDVPLQPGETYVFMISESSLEGWEHFRERENRPDAKRLVLVFQLLSFGDGTGIAGESGLSFPRPPDAKSSLNGCEPEPNLSDSSGAQGRDAPWRRWPAIFSMNDLPASFLPANFLFT